MTHPLFNTVRPDDREFPPDTTCWAACARIGEHYLVAEWIRGEPRPTASSVGPELRAAREVIEQDMLCEDVRETMAQVRATMAYRVGRRWFGLQHRQAAAWLPAHSIGPMQ